MVAGLAHSFLRGESLAEYVARLGGAPQELAGRRGGAAQSIAGRLLGDHGAATRQKDLRLRAQQLHVQQAQAALARDVQPLRDGALSAG